MCLHRLCNQYCFNLVSTLNIINYRVPITTTVVSLNPIHGEVYLIQHYVIKFVSDLRKFGGFPWEVQFPLSIELTAMI